MGEDESDMCKILVWMTVVPPLVLVRHLAAQEYPPAAALEAEASTRQLLRGHEGRAEGGRGPPWTWGWREKTNL